jgi:hypothetical protein
MFVVVIDLTQTTNAQRDSTMRRDADGGRRHCAVRDAAGSLRPTTLGSSSTCTRDRYSLALFLSIYRSSVHELFFGFVSLLVGTVLLLRRGCW